MRILATESPGGENRQSYRRPPGPCGKDDQCHQIPGHGLTRVTVSSWVKNLGFPMEIRAPGTAVKIARSSVEVFSQGQSVRTPSCLSKHLSCKAIASTPKLCFEQVRGEAVAQRVNGDRLAQIRPACGHAAGRLQRRGADRPIPLTAGEQPGRRLGQSPIGAKDAQELRRASRAPLRTTATARVIRKQIGHCGANTTRGWMASPGGS
jgi:hypothetical protein